LYPNNVPQAERPTLAIEAANRARRHAVEAAASAREAEIRVALIEADRECARRLEKAESDHNVAVMRAAMELSAWWRALPDECVHHDDHRPQSF